KVLAAAATLTLAASLGTAAVMSASPAGAATPSCGGPNPAVPVIGPGCIDIFSWQFGDFTHPDFTLDVFRQKMAVGAPLILFRTANSDPALDFSAEFDGLTSDFYAAGLVSSAVAMHWGCVGGLIVPVIIPGGQIVCSPGYTNDPAGEIEYAPYGVDSGLCAGLAATAFNGEGVTLQPCGVSARTVWIVDTVDAGRNITNAGLPLINGSDTNFSHPYVLTYPKGAEPWAKPRVQLTVTQLTGFTQPGVPFVPIISTIDSNQLWSALFGVLP
ncbi:MAG TPA: hypothetical protein VGS06_46280, partial [Streptosporangiaceae bacterium]|nr:hypothetical protein [Streptosporangiaceae bacterium]